MKRLGGTAAALILVAALAFTGVATDWPPSNQENDFWVDARDGLLGGCPRWLVVRRSHLVGRIGAKRCTQYAISRCARRGVYHCILYGDGSTPVDVN